MRTSGRCATWSIALGVIGVAVAGGFAILGAARRLRQPDGRKARQRSRETNRRSRSGLHSKLSRRRGLSGALGTTR